MVVICVYVCVCIRAHVYGGEREGFLGRGEKSLSGP
jgi:hypothetical protein